MGALHVDHAVLLPQHDADVNITLCVSAYQHGSTLCFVVRMTGVRAGGALVTMFAIGDQRLGQLPLDPDLVASTEHAVGVLAVALHTVLSDGAAFVLQQQVKARGW
ncbi:MAG: hypothetical protein DI587_35965, partial [Variovorax paradoxus]